MAGEAQQDVGTEISYAGFVLRQYMVQTRTSVRMYMYVCRKNWQMSPACCLLRFEALFSYFFFYSALKYAAIDVMSDNGLGGGGLHPPPTVVLTLFEDIGC